jgi:hypothetical protein
MKSARHITRRRVLRGMLAGSAVSVGLPILDCLLNENGTAFAASGAPLPARFATWYWPLGLGEDDWVPKSTGTNYTLPPQMAPLEPLKKKMNFFTGGQVFLDGQSNNVHFTGLQGLMTGKVSNSREYLGSIDALISGVIGNGSRFRSIEVACAGSPRDCWSARPDTGVQPAEISPVALYSRIFGAEFKDPNAAEFTPDPDVMLKKSVLSGIAEERRLLEKRLGAADREKLDNYFTSLRELEQKLQIQLQKPEPLPACTIPKPLPMDKEPTVTLAVDAIERANLFAGLLAHALACGQTNVVNLAISRPQSGLRKQGDATAHHTHTHEEQIDPKLGYQPVCRWFTDSYMTALAYFVRTLDSIKEGDRTLLDSMVVFAFTDHGAPRLHSVRNYPILTFGSGGGRIKTGMHIGRPGDQVTRVGLTIQQAMGVQVSSWGVGSNRVTSPISEVLA